MAYPPFFFLGGKGRGTLGQNTPIAAKAFKYSRQQSPKKKKTPYNPNKKKIEKKLKKASKTPDQGQKIIHPPNTATYLLLRKDEFLKRKGKGIMVQRWS